MSEQIVDQYALKEIVRNGESSTAEIISAIESFPQLIWKIPTRSFTEGILAYAISCDFSIVGSLKEYEITENLVSLIDYKECKISESFAIDSTIYKFLVRYCYLLDNATEVVEYFEKYDRNNLLQYLEEDSYAYYEDYSSNDENEEDC